MIQIKRIYEAPASGDGYRVLVDRLWPRGISKAEAHIDEWCKEAGPSNELRQWFGHDPAKYADFRQKYLAELAQNESARQLKAHQGQMTLLYSAKDTEHNQAVVLKEFLEK